jgi:hypothetical protein
VTLGSGKRFFGDGTIAGGLELTGSKASETGVTVNTYEGAGEIKAGSFALDEPTEAEIERRRRLAASGWSPLHAPIWPTFTRHFGQAGSCLSARGWFSVMRSGEERWISPDEDSGAS